MARAEADSDRVAALFKRHGHRVYRRASRLLGSAADAEEATQEVFIRALRHVDPGRSERETVCWLYAITTHWCLGLLRDRKRRGELVAERLGPLAGDEAAGPARGDDLVLVRRLLREVDERQAQAAVHVYVDGMSHAEAAEVMGVSRRTIGNLIDRFEKAMRALDPDARPRERAS